MPRARRGGSRRPCRCCRYSRGFYLGGGGCAQVRRSSGLAFQGRKRSSARPARGFPPLRPHSSREAVSQVRTLRPAIRAVAVTVQMTAAFRAVSPFREPSAFFLVTTGPRIWRSAALLSLSGTLIRGRDQASATEGDSAVLSGSLSVADGLS